MSSANAFNLDQSKNLSFGKKIYTLSVGNEFNPVSPILPNVNDLRENHHFLLFP